MHNNRTVLITGSTDGIGKATAIELAKKQYTIHLLGTSKRRGELVLQQLREINPKGKHLLYLTDLSEMNAVNSFLDDYLQENDSLDVLVLNAGIFPKHTSLSNDGIDLSFSVGYISRYLFSVRLNKLLEKSSLGKVVHINGSVIGSIKYQQLNNPKYGKMTRVWQNSVGSALLVYYWNQLSKTNVAHMHWNPGIVNTQTVKTQGTVVRYLSKLMGMIEPEEAGQSLAKHIDTVLKPDMLGKFFVKGNESKTPRRISAGEDMLKELISFSESFTQVAISIY